MADRHDLVEEVVPIRGRDLRILRPRDSEALLDEHAFEHEEFLPYWAELWPSGVALAHALAGRSLRGARTLELGCGLGLGGVAAAVAGGRVTVSDWSAEAVAFARENAARNDVRVDALVADWAAPEPLVARAPWDLVIASDVLYERRNAAQLEALLPRLVDERGEVWLADPGRPALAPFLETLDRGWRRDARSDAERPSVVVHRLTKAPVAAS